MHHPRRSSVVLVGLLLALVLPATAFALRVHVRVEGATTTLYGASEPLVTPYVGPFAAGDTTFELSEPTALGALEAASRLSELFYLLTPSSFGPYVSQVGRTAGAGNSGWVFKVNGVSPPVGADAYVLEDGDTVLWYYATFGETGGPPTLDLDAVSGRCYQAYSVDDAGTRVAAKRVTFQLDSRSRFSLGGRICPAGHWHTLRATKDGSIRSAVVRPG